MHSARLLGHSTMNIGWVLPVPLDCAGTQHPVQLPSSPTATEPLCSLVLIVFEHSTMLAGLSLNRWRSGDGEQLFHLLVVAWHPVQSANALQQASAQPAGRTQVTRLS